MRFKIKNTDVIISFSFFSLILLSMTVDKSGIFKICLITSLIHECVHLVFIMLFKAEVSYVRLSLFGGDIKRAGVSLENYKESLISLSAPIFNIIIGFIFCLYKPDNLFGSVNLLTGLFNIMPFYSFDGGRGLQYLVKDRVNERMAKSICFALSLLVCFSFLTINGVLIKNNRGNIFFLIISLYMLILLVFKGLHE